MIEDKIGVIKKHKSKNDRRYNDQKIKDKRVEQHQLDAP